MGDTLLTGVSNNREVRLYVAKTTGVVDYLRHLHDMSPMSTMIVGRLATITVILGMMSKIEDESITVHLKGSNDFKLGVAVADTHGHIKIATKFNHIENYYREDGALDVGKAVGSEGFLYVIRDLGFGEPQVGSVKLVSGEIAEDFTHYFAQSEQIPTAVSLGVSLDKENLGVSSAGGFLIQLLPEATEETISYLENRLKELRSITDMTEKMSTKQIAAYIMGDLGMVELEERPVHYKCDCSREKVESGIIKLGAKEIKAMADEDGGAEVVCHFCTSKYYFTKDDLYKLYDYVGKLQ